MKVFHARIASCQDILLFSVHFSAPELRLAADNQHKHSCGDVANAVTQNILILTKKYFDKIFLQKISQNILILTKNRNERVVDLYSTEILEIDRENSD
jgi:hypothetical protein